MVRLIRPANPAGTALVWGPAGGPPGCSGLLRAARSCAALPASAALPVSGVLAGA